MKVFVLGGAGWIGQATAQVLAETDLVAEIVVAGRNLAVAERTAAELGEKWREKRNE